MFCSKCGKENAEDARFCSACGNALASASQPSGTAAPASPAVPAAPANYTEPVASSGGINKGVIIGAIVALVVVVVLIIVGVTQCSGKDDSVQNSGDAAMQAGPVEKLPSGTYVFYRKSYSSYGDQFEKQISFKTYEGNTATLEIQGGDLAVSGNIETAGTEGDSTIVKMTDLKYSSSDWGSVEPQEIYLLIPNGASERNIEGTWKLQIKVIRSGSISYMNLYGKVNSDGTVEGDSDTFADEGVVTGHYAPSIPEYQKGTSEYNGSKFVFSNQDEEAYYAATVTLD